MLQLGGPVEVVLESALATPGDQQDVTQPRGGRLFDHVLDGGLVHNGQHFLRDSLRRGQESCSEAGGRDDRLGHGGGVWSARSPLVGRRPWVWCAAVERWALVVWGAAS